MGEAKRRKEWVAEGGEDWGSKSARAARVAIARMADADARGLPRGGRGVAAIVAGLIARFRR